MFFSFSFFLRPRVRDAAFDHFAPSTLVDVLQLAPKFERIEARLRDVLQPQQEKGEFLNWGWEGGRPHR